MITDDEILELEQLIKDQSICDAKKTLIDFTIYTKPNFIPYWFHTKYYEKLNHFAEGKIKKLMVFIPPQHGKSEGSTRRLPAYLIGKDPNLKIAITSFAASKARKFNREIQRIIDDEKYRDIFKTTLSDGHDGYIRTTDELEIVGTEGSIKTVGVDGQLTGDPVDVLIMDDLYKSYKEAWSPVIQQNVIDWYDSVAEARLHNDSRQLIVFTRWDQKDLAGHILKQDPKEWQVVIYPAIKEGDPTEDDPRENGEPLWPERHSLDKLQKTRSRTPHIFQSLYQQDPSPKEGLMYENEFRTYDKLPEFTSPTRTENYTDTADTGEDYLCSVDYIPYEYKAYVLDITYTQDPMEETEKLVPLQLVRNKCNLARVESNNGGRGFARNVEKKVLGLGGETVIEWFHQSDNKESRIYSQSNRVNRDIIFPSDWKYRWPKFAEDVQTYKKKGGNLHDDAPDVLTGIVEHMPYESDDFWTL